MDEDDISLESELEETLDVVFNECLNIFWEASDNLEKDLLGGEEHGLTKEEREELSSDLDTFCQNTEKSFKKDYDLFEEFSKRAVKQLTERYWNQISEINHSRTAHTSYLSDFSDGSPIGDSQQPRDVDPSPNRELDFLRQRMKQKFNEYVRLRKEKNEIDRMLEIISGVENNMRLLENECCKNNEGNETLEFILQTLSLDEKNFEFGRKENRRFSSFSEEGINGTSPGSFEERFERMEIDTPTKSSSGSSNLPNSGQRLFPPSPRVFEGVFGIRNGDSSMEICDE